MSSQSHILSKYRDILNAADIIYFILVSTWICCLGQHVSVHVYVGILIICIAYILLHYIL
jgi:hypothetical protein